MVNVAILGFGVVGSGVAEVLDTNERHIEGKVDDLIRLKYILDVRDFPDSPFAGKVVHDFSVIEQDPEVSIVVETIGGAKVALDFTRRALQAGKSVITSNKELVAEHGCELLRLAQEKGVSYLFEASVGGGIPIIRPLNQCLAANEIEEITGILNGTTNYILTRMIRAGLSFDDALREAQANGYAEQDPTADIEGHDACRKICILASLAFGRHIYPRQVPTEGITGVTPARVVARGVGGFTLACPDAAQGNAVLDAGGRYAGIVTRTDGDTCTVEFSAAAGLCGSYAGLVTPGQWVLTGLPADCALTAGDIVTSAGGDWLGTLAAAPAPDADGLTAQVPLTDTADLWGTVYFVKK